ncbi:hypothetical protein [uncultured Thiodictyon sp.]|uniref:hypothetical protein n=1 Tax=uncultured Thiodictyon sp. TaxID=1846217 RepID=UPI0025F75DEE|nr:hypothetical protein [uncultured Thiodictyon sp.]
MTNTTTSTPATPLYRSLSIFPHTRQQLCEAAEERGCTTAGFVEALVDMALCALEDGKLTLPPVRPDARPAATRRAQFIRWARVREKAAAAEARKAAAAA